MLAGTACSHTSEKISDPLLGGWIATPQGENVPAGASVFIGFWHNGTYTLSTKFGKQESRIDGNYACSRNTLYFDFNTSKETRYGYTLDKRKNTLVLKAADGTKTRYERVQMDLLPVD